MASKRRKAPRVIIRKIARGPKAFLHYNGKLEWITDRGEPRKPPKSKERLDLCVLVRMNDLFALIESIEGPVQSPIHQ